MLGLSPKYTRMELYKAWVRYGQQHHPTVSPLPLHCKVDPMLKGQQAYESLKPGATDAGKPLFNGIDKGVPSSIVAVIPINASLQPVKTPKRKRKTFAGILAKHSARWATG